MPPIVVMDSGLDAARRPGMTAQGYDFAYPSKNRPEAMRGRRATGQL
jgi:hypothetical protein